MHSSGAQVHYKFKCTNAASASRYLSRRCSRLVSPVLVWLPLELRRAMVSPIEEHC